MAGIGQVRSERIVRMHVGIKWHPEGSTSKKRSRGPGQKYGGYEEVFFTAFQAFIKVIYLASQFPSPLIRFGPLQVELPDLVNFRCRDCSPEAADPGLRIQPRNLQQFPYWKIYLCALESPGEVVKAFVKVSLPVIVHRDRKEESVVVILTFDRRVQNRFAISVMVRDQRAGACKRLQVG